jgi:hypothetical protein
MLVSRLGVKRELAGLILTREASDFAVAFRR